MTPRLESAELTPEDTVIDFDRLPRRGQFGQVLRTFSLMADTRDAELMVWAQDHQRYSGVYQDDRFIDVRGPFAWKYRPELWRP